MGLSAPSRRAAAVSPLPKAEEVFLAWLASRPAGTDLALAAEAELSRLRRYDGAHPGPERLAALFATLRDTLARGRAVGGAVPGIARRCTRRRRQAPRTAMN